MNQNPVKAVVLLSGGLDSSTTLAIAKSKGYEVYAISFDYGQKHSAELDAAANVANSQKVARHVVTRVDLGSFGGSALTADFEVPKNRPKEEITTGIPVTYVPARNTVFLSLALAWAEVVGSTDIFIGVNALDFSGYPDCRPDFIEAFERMANLGTKMGVEGKSIKIHAPLISMTKKEIVETGMRLGVDYGLTMTCYAPTTNGVSCGECDACQLRIRGFQQAGLADPIRYQMEGGNGVLR